MQLDRFHNLIKIRVRNPTIQFIIRNINLIIILKYRRRSQISNISHRLWLGKIIVNLVLQQELDLWEVILKLDTVEVSLQLSKTHLIN